MRGKSIGKSSKSFRKAELSMTVIVGAVIALIIIIVLIAVFTGKLGPAVKGFTACSSNGGQCVDRLCDYNTESQLTSDCGPGASGQPMKCCIKMFDTTLPPPVSPSQPAK